MLLQEKSIMVINSNNPQLYMVHDCTHCFLLDWNQMDLPHHNCRMYFYDNLGFFQVIIFLVCLKKKIKGVLMIIFSSTPIVVALKLDGIFSNADWKVIAILPIFLAIGLIIYSISLLVVAKVQFDRHG